jgi:putative FmdB family regulatory protein
VPEEAETRGEQDARIVAPPVVESGKVPIYEFECEDCGTRFDELVAVEATVPPCPNCGAERSRRLLSTVAPPGRQPRGAAVRSDESRRREKEAGHRERLARDLSKRAKGERP